VADKKRQTGAEKSQNKRGRDGYTGVGVGKAFRSDFRPNLLLAGAHAGQQAISGRADRRLWFDEDWASVTEDETNTKTSRMTSRDDVTYDVSQIVRLRDCRGHVTPWTRGSSESSGPLPDRIPLSLNQSTSQSIYLFAQQSVNGRDKKNYINVKVLKVES